MSVLPIAPSDLGDHRSWRASTRRAIAVAMFGFVAACGTIAGPAPVAGATPAQAPAPPSSAVPATTAASVPVAPAVDAGAGDVPADTPQPTGQPLPSKRQRVADSLVAAFLLVVLVGGVAVALWGNRTARHRAAAERVRRDAAVVEPDRASH